MAVKLAAAYLRILCLSSLFPSSASLSFLFIIIITKWENSAYKPSSIGAQIYETQYTRHDYPCIKSTTSTCIITMRATWWSLIRINNAWPCRWNPVEIFFRLGCPSYSKGDLFKGDDQNTCFQRRIIQTPKNYSPHMAMMLFPLLLGSGSGMHTMSRAKGYGQQENLTSKSVALSRLFAAVHLLFQDNTMYMIIFPNQWRSENSRVACIHENHCRVLHVGIYYYYCSWFDPCSFLFSEELYLGGWLLTATLGIYKLSIAFQELETSW